MPEPDHTFPVPTRSCQPGETVLLQGLPRDVFAAALTAFTTASADDLAGSAFTVRIECSVAQQLSFALATSIATNYEVAPADD